MAVTNGDPSARFAKSEYPVTEWLRRFDNDAVEELMKHYRPLLHRIAVDKWDRRYAGQYDVSEVLHETWAKVAKMEPKDRFESRDKFRAYLIKSLRNQLRSWRRRLLGAKKRSALCQVTDTSLLEQFAASDPEQLTTPLEKLIQKEMATDILKAVLRLPRELQRLLYWRFRREMTYQQIGEKVGRSDVQVRHLVTCCVQQIRKDLQGKYRLDI
jgi:RNA polymerase sigma-70 factor (ECF subfamily)